MKTKTIIIVALALITLAFGCVSMKQSGEPEEPVTGEIQQEEVLSEPAAQEVEPIPEPVMPATEMVSVTASVVNIRSGPSTKNEVIAKVKRGDELEMLGQKGSWCNVKLSNGSEGWIYKKFVK